MYGCGCCDDTYQPQATLERLKLRFGDTAMHNNTVMLKDVDDSRRVNALVTGKLAKPPAKVERLRKVIAAQHPNVSVSEFGSLIVSRHFWFVLIDVDVDVDADLSACLRVCMSACLRVCVHVRCNFECMPRKSTATHCDAWHC